MNYQAFTNDALLMMHHSARGALAVDDELSQLGQEKRFRVRETPDWKEHATGLEAEMLRRSMSFVAINWSEDQPSVDACLQPGDEPPKDSRSDIPAESQVRLRSRMAAALGISSGK
jgi:hypothetical protein